MIRKLWDKWCDKVDEHNSKQDYVTQEECWDYFTIFYPFLCGLFISLILYVVTFLETGFFYPKLFIATFVIVFLFVGLILIINWKLND